MAAVVDPKVKKYADDSTLMISDNNFGEFEEKRSAKFMKIMECLFDKNLPIVEKRNLSNFVQITNLKIVNFALDVMIYP